MKIKVQSILNIVAFLAIFVTTAFKDITGFCRAVQILFFLVSLAAAVRTRNVKLSFYFEWAGVLLLYMLLSAIWATNVSRVVQYFISFVQVVMIGYAITMNIHSEEDAKRYLRYYIIGATALALRTIIQTPAELWGQGRIAFEGYHANGIANILTFAALFLFIRMVTTKSKKEKLFLLAILLFNIFVMIVTAAKKNMLVLPIVMFVAFVLLQNRVVAFLKNAVKYAIVIAIIIVIATEYIDVFSYSLERITDFFESSESGNLDASSAERLYLMTTAINVFLRNPFLGCGLDNFRLMNVEGHYAHNNYLELAASLGVVGVILFYAIYFYIGYHVLKKWRTAERGGRVLIFSFLMCALALELFQVTYYLEYTHILLAIFWCYSRFVKRESAAQIAA